MASIEEIGFFKDVMSYKQQNLGHTLTDLPQPNVPKNGLSLMG